MTVSRNQYEVKVSLTGDSPLSQFYGLKAHKIGGQGRNRTGVDGFAGRSMTTLPPGLGVEFLEPLLRNAVFYYPMQHNAMC
jgi:hypothetical protein